MELYEVQRLVQRVSDLESRVEALEEAQINPYNIVVVYGRCCSRTNEPQADSDGSCELRSSVFRRRVRLPSRR